MRRPGLWSLLVLAALPAPPALATVASDICPATADPCVVSSAIAVAPDSTLDLGSRALDVRAGGSLAVSSGLMTILAGSVRVESGGALLGSSPQATGASIKVMTSGDIRVETGASGAGTIDVSADLNPGEIDLLAHGDAVLAGSIKASANGTLGDGGVINVSADGNVSVTGPIAAQASLKGLGGEITVRAGGTLATTAIVRADGGDGGDVELDALGGDITTGADVNASAGGTFGDGGTVTVIASGNVTANGNYVLPGAGSPDEGGGDGGDADVEATGGTLTLNGSIDSHGASPDGDAGEVDVTAGLDYKQPGSIFDQANGGGGCGGEMSATVGRSFTLGGLIDVSGGYCGGDMEADAATASVGASAEVSADSAMGAGTVTLDAQQITAAGKLHATGTATGGLAGVVQLTGCTLSVPYGASIKTDGEKGENLLQASGQLTIGGTLSSRPTGEDRFEYRDPSRPPILLSTALIRPTQDCAPATGCLTMALPACTASAVCGNGVPEPGEECDDGNTNACDGCSPTCQVERCGNGVVECGEECDDGPANGGPGDPCDATCHAVQGLNVTFIPGSHRGTGCLLEWAVQAEPMGGLPTSTLTCIDGDPTCDQDGTTDGRCTFHVSACLNVTDSRLPACTARTIDVLKARRPSSLHPRDAVEEKDNAPPFLSALESFGTTVRKGTTIFQEGTPFSGHDRCTPPFVQLVPHAAAAVGRRLLSAGAVATSGDSTSNRIALACAPNPSLCGNGVVEVTEQCDDGNRVSCDGCSDYCRREICGNRVVDCGEQCDDGAQNGQPGDPCSARCTWEPPPGRIPGGSRSRDCVAEWALAASQLAVASNGLPSSKQICVDNDPSCDFDPTPGTCRFHLWACVGGDDARLGCAASAVASLGLRRPSASQLAAAAARQALLDAFGRLPLPTAAAGEVCSGRVDVDVPAGRKRLVVSADATTTDGVRDRDSVKLSCVPAA